MEKMDKGCPRGQACFQISNLSFGTGSDAVGSSTGKKGLPKPADTTTGSVNTNDSSGSICK